MVNTLHHSPCGAEGIFSKVWGSLHAPCLLLWALLLACGASAHAASPLMIWPLDPVIEGQQRAAALWIENRGPRPLSLQARVMQWTQVDGKDALTAQKDVVASPPISVIPPGARQMIRLMATHAVQPGTEHAYRVLVDELPPPLPEGVTTPPQMGVQIQLRYSVPLFVYAPGTVGQRMTPDLEKDRPLGASPLQPDLTWHTERDSDGTSLVVHNHGKGFARLTQVHWTVERASDVPIDAGLFGYVLPGSTRRWELDAPPPPGGALEASVNGRPASLRRKAP